MPSRMIHYLVAEKIMECLPINDRNRFILGSICPDLSRWGDESKAITHCWEYFEEQEGCNWMQFADKYKQRIPKDDLYLGIYCHLITDAIWYHDVIDVQICSQANTEEERGELTNKGYDDFHRLNYILRNEYDLKYDFHDDRNIDYDGVRMEFYEELTHGLYRDFFDDPEAFPDELVIYPYKMSVECIQKCIAECIHAVSVFRERGEILRPEKYYVRRWA